MPITSVKTYKLSDLNLSAKLQVQSVIAYEVATDVLVDFTYYDKDSSPILENFQFIYENSIYMLLQHINYPKEYLNKKLYSIYYKEEGSLLILTSDSKEFVLKIELD